MPFLSLSPWQAAETGRSLAYSACSMNNLFIPFAKERRRHISTNIHYNHFEIILRVAAKIITFSYHSYKSRPKTNNSKRQEPKRCISHTLTKIHTLRFIVCFYVLFFFSILAIVCGCCELPSKKYLWWFCAHEIHYSFTPSNGANRKHSVSWCLCCLTLFLMCAIAIFHNDLAAIVSFSSLPLFHFFFFFGLDWLNSVQFGWLPLRFGPLSHNSSS